MSTRHRQPNGSLKERDDYHFTTGPGLIQPLFLTAWKYRHPIYRRRAIALLSIAGHEGPWSGRREARVTSRLMELEETWSSDSLLKSTHQHPSPTGVRAGAGSDNWERLGTPSPTTPILSDGIDFDSLTVTTGTAGIAPAFSRDGLSMEPRERLTEQVKRVHVADMVETALIQGMGISSENLSGWPGNCVIVRFSRCQDMESMLSHPCGHGRGQERNLDSHSQGPCADNPYWERWEEVLEF